VSLFSLRGGGNYLTSLSCSTAAAPFPEGGQGLSDTIHEWGPELGSNDTRAFRSRVAGVNRMSLSRLWGHEVAGSWPLFGDEGTQGG